jgi:DNA mismatch repair protein MSH4
MLVYQENGFVFTLKKEELEGQQLPKGFVNVVTRKGKWVFSSIELVSIPPKLLFSLLLLNDF